MYWPEVCSAVGDSGGAVVGKSFGVSVEKEISYSFHIIFLTNDRGVGIFLVLVWTLLFQVYEKFELQKNFVYYPAGCNYPAGFFSLKKDK